MKKSIQTALNNQLNLEYASAYFYLSMSTYFEEQGFSGIAKWMRAQHAEEQEHAMKIYEFLFERDQKAEFGALTKPKANWKSVLAAFQDGLTHEQGVTRNIHKIVDAATKEKDHATVAFLQWFVTEQVEEEATFKDIIQKIEFLGQDNNVALYMLDKELGERA